MWKRILLTVLFCFVVSVTTVSAVTSSPPATSSSSTDNPYGYRFTEDEYAQYKQATENCDTPSLECLVKYTTRFAAMEWALDIAKGQSVADGGNGGGGVFASVLGLVDHMYRYPAAHTGTYVADIMNTAGFAPKAYAQGLGFASLDPVLNLWKIFRNVSYFFFIIIFMVLGFMIMLRKRISGQAAVTAQQAIPSVIISLVLVTFSYAIAGFMIDMMYVVMFLIVGLFEGINSGITVGGQNVTGGGLINLNFIGLISFLFQANAGAQAAGTNVNISTAILEAAASGENVATYLGGVIGGLTLTLVITIAVLIGAVRLFFELLKSYAAIIMYVVASPIILMFGAFPGKDVFWGWLKSLIGNLVAFPAVLFMLVLFIEFTQGDYSGGATAGFMPPFLMGNGTAANMVGPLLGLAIILGLPDIVKEIKKAAGAGDGGIGAMLAGFAFKNAGRGLEYAENTIPAFTGAGSTLPQLVRNYRAARTYGDYDTKKALKFAFTGGNIGGQKYSSAKGAFGTGAEQGMKLRRAIDRAKSGRLFDPEDATNLLRSIYEKDKKKATTPTTDAEPKTLSTS